jgi:hypothetical protein
MKLRLQLAEMLLASPKPGTDASHGDETFGTTMEEMMATPASGQPSLVEMPPALQGKQLPIGTHLGTAKPYQSIDIPATEIHAANQVPQLGAPFATMPQQAAEQRELSQVQDSQGQSSQHPAAKAPLPSEQPLPEEAKQAIDARTLLLQSPIVPELRASSQPLADATFPDATSVKDASSHAKHKTETMPDEPIQSADGQAASVLPIISHPIDVVVPIPTLQPEKRASQPDGLPPTSLKPSSKAVSVHTPGQEASRRAPVFAAAFGHDDLPATPLATSGYFAVPQPPGMTASKGDKLPESAPSNGKSESSTKTHLTAQPIGRTNAIDAGAPNQAFHPQGSLSADSAETDAKQTDIRAPKEAERKTASEVKSEVRFNATGLLTPTPPAVQHQVSPNVSSAMTASAEKSIATHRPEAGAAEVLQRMDLASSPGAVQLRADARRLDVGVSSGSLGWVEVRATTSASGRVDATLHVQNDASAHVLTSQSREISDYAREHSVQLGQVSVGVGTGDSAQGQSHSTDARDGNGPRPRGTAVQPLGDTEPTYHGADAVSLISVRA